MAMNRREWLTTVFGAAAAAAVAPLVNLTDATPAFWNQAPIKELLKWKIAFPDGTIYMFNATVIAEKLLDDGTVSLEMRPEGMPEVSRMEPLSDAEQGPLRGTTFERDGVPIADIQEIELPRLERDVVSVDVDDNGFEIETLGILRQRGTLTINYKKE